MYLPSQTLILTTAALLLSGSNIPYATAEDGIETTEVSTNWDW